MVDAVLQVGVFAGEAQVTLLDGVGHDRIHERPEIDHPQRRPPVCGAPG
ncbi:MAG: hypothetical protein AB1720_04095 [Pseudomonadota bacterium]